LLFLNLSNSHTSGNIALINYVMISRESDSALALWPAISVVLLKLKDFSMPQAL